METSRPNTRLYARFPVQLPAKVAARPFPREINAEILDIGVGGALVRVGPPLDGEIRLSFQLDGTRCAFDALIVREAQSPAGSDRMTYGVEFRYDPEMESRLKSLLPPKVR